MHADAVDIDVLGSLGFKGNFLSLALEKAGQFVDPMDVIESVAYIPADSSEKVINVTKNYLDSQQLVSLSVFVRKFFFFKKHKLTIVYHKEIGDYHITASDVPLGEKIRFHVSLENLNRRFIEMGI